jgi:hypothetical protein
MEKKLNNPVSRSIVDSIWNRFGDYFPEIQRFESGGRSNYAVGAKLPEKEHKKWIAHVSGNPNFREVVKQEIEGVFANYVFHGRTFLKIQWTSHGTLFETDGVNGCLVYVVDSVSYGYGYHNIDTFEQAMVLFIALSKYLPRLYSILECLESGEIDSETFSPLQERFTQTITLNLVPDCQMKYGECLHWKSWLCQYCTRNPKAFYIETQKDLTRIGDKWEPEGGLPGREICPICGANISTDKCPFCNE